jgi:hypothetical protein
MKLNSKVATASRFPLRLQGPRGAGRTLLGAGLGLVLMVGGAVGVGASTAGGSGSPFGSWFSPRPGPVVWGTVATAPTSSTGSFTVTAAGGVTWTVDLTSSTTYTEPGVTSPTYSDVAVGDQVAVSGTSTASDTVSASSVMITVRPVTVGTVTTAPASSTGSFTLTTCKGVTWTVDLTGSTTYTERGVTSPTYSGVAVGDEAVVFGTSTGTDTATASSVVIIQRPVVSGTVATAPVSPTGSFTLTTRKGVTWTVHLTGSTTYTERGAISPSYVNVAVGDQVVVYGTSTGTDSVGATAVAIMQRPVVVGTVATAPATPTGSFTVSAWKSQTVTVDLTASTTYTEVGVTSPGWVNVAVGDLVVVYGTSTGTGTFTATSVVIIQRPVVAGTVATAPASGTGSFTVSARQSQTWTVPKDQPPAVPKDQTWTVDLSGSTVYREWGVSSPGYANVVVGDQVAVFGTSTGSNTVKATLVVIFARPIGFPVGPPLPWAVSHLSKGSVATLTGFHVGIGGDPGSFGGVPTSHGSGTNPQGGGWTSGSFGHQGSQGGGSGFSGGRQPGGPTGPGR